MSENKWLTTLEQLGAGAVGELVENSPALKSAIQEERGASAASKLDWLPILIELGESVVARILDNSPDAASAIEEARENFQKAEDEAAELGRAGHE